MSLEALAVAMTADLQAEASLTLIYLADGAYDDASIGDDITVPHLPSLAAKVGVDEQRLRLILEDLRAVGVISPCARHPFDFFANTEGFRLHLEVAPTVPHIESPWSKDLRRGA